MIAAPVVPTAQTARPLTPAPCPATPSGARSTSGSVQRPILEATVVGDMRRRALEVRDIVSVPCHIPGAVLRGDDITILHIFERGACCSQLCVDQMSIGEDARVVEDGPALALIAANIDEPR